MAADDENNVDENLSGVKTIEELNTERESLREEIETLKANITSLQNELKETKKLNYTLARQIPSKKQETFDDALINMFGKKGNSNGH